MLKPNPYQLKTTCLPPVDVIQLYHYIHLCNVNWCSDMSFCSDDGWLDL